MNQKFLAFSTILIKKITFSSPRPSHLIHSNLRIWPAKSGYFPRVNIGFNVILSPFPFKRQGISFFTPLQLSKRWRIWMEETTFRFTQLFVNLNTNKISGRGEGEGEGEGISHSN